MWEGTADVSASLPLEGHQPAAHGQSNGDEGEKGREEKGNNYSCSADTHFRVITQLAC